MLIPSLRCGNLSVTICVRVSRFWDFSDPQDDARLLHCDMVLLDEEGNSIHATIYPPFIEKFRPLIKEGSVYNMTYFRVRASNNLYKPVPNDIMITFTNWTKLEQVIEIPPAFPTLTYSLTHIDQIHSRIDHKDYYTDAIGIVTSVSNVLPHRSKGQQASSLKRNISICSARFGLHEVLRSMSCCGVPKPPYSQESAYTRMGRIPHRLCYLLARSSKNMQMVFV